MKDSFQLPDELTDRLILTAQMMVQQAQHEELRRLHLLLPQPARKPKLDKITLTRLAIYARRRMVRGFRIATF